MSDDPKINERLQKELNIISHRSDKQHQLLNDFHKPNEDVAEITNEIESLSLKIEAHPSDSEILIERGISYLALSLFGEAIRDFNKAIVISPSHYRAYCLCALALLGLNRIDEALEKCNKAIEMNPTASFAYATRGFVYSESDRDIEKAEIDFAKAFDCSFNDGMLYKMRAKMYFKQGKYKEAISDFSESIKLGTSEIDNLNYIGVGYLELHDLNNAIRKFTEAIDLTSDPEQKVFLLNNRSIAYKVSEKFLQAAEDAKAALNLQPGNRKALVLLAEVADEQGLNQEAINCYHKAIEADVDNQNNGDLLLNISILHIKMGNDDDAISSISQAIKMKDDVDYYLLRGRYHLDSNNYKLAKTDFATACRLFPDNGEANYWLGYIFFRQGKDKRAIKDFNKALEKGYCSRSIYLNKGIALSQFQKYEESRECLDKALELSSTNQEKAFVLFHKSYTYVDENQKSLALTFLQKAAEHEFTKFDWVNSDVFRDLFNEDPNYLTVLKKIRKNALAAEIEIKTEMPSIQAIPEAQKADAPTEDVGTEDDRKPQPWYQSCLTMICIYIAFKIVLALFKVLF